MTSASWLLLISAALFQTCHCGAQEFQSNSCGSFLVPRHVLSGTNSVVWISGRKPSNFTLRIVDETILLEDKLFIEELTPVEFQLPVEIKRDALSLQIFTDCNEKGENCSLCDDYSMQVLSGEKQIEIQLESSVYEAGDTVSIWLAMIDHSGNANFDLAADVVVKDPSNFTVKMWKTVQLHFGVGNFQMELSKGAAEGSWSVIARSQRNQYSKQFTVRDRTAITSQRNQQDNQLVEALGEPHFVEINFSPRTRLEIYENLPFIGELMTKTSEKGILVRLELVDLVNQTILYNSTVEFGKTHSQLFVIPGLESLPGNISMQAVLESIEGQPVDNKFVLATRRLDVNMNNTCQFQLFPTSAKYDFQEGELLNILLSSSCPFPEGKINYVITSDSGHVTAWGQEFFTVANATEEEHFVNLTITVTDSMKPRSLVSVFSVVDDGLILGDSFQVRVRPKEEKEKEVRVSSEVNDILKINITKAPGEMHCVIGSWESGSDGKLASFVNITQPNSLDTSTEDNNSDLDTVLFGLVKDTWMVQCLEPTETTWEEIDVPVASPDEASARTLQVFSIDVTGKIRPSSVYSMEEPRKPSWDLDFQLPPTIRLGEELIVDVDLHSNQENCSQTQLHMALKGGAIFSANRKKFLSQPACLAPKSKTTYRVGVELTELGSFALTVQVKGSNTNSCCGLSTAGFILLDGQDELSETTTLSKTTTVLEGGFINKKKDSYLFCLDGIDYNTNGSFNDGEAFYLSAASKSIVLQVAAAGDIRIALHKEKGTTESAYHFVLGGDDNSLSWISFGSNSFSNILEKVATPKLLRSDKLQTFWISWDSKKLDKSQRRRRDSNGESLLQIPKLSLGRGSNVGSRTLLTVLLEGLQDFNYGFHYVNFATGPGTPGYFRIWGLSGGSEQTTSTLQLAIPAGSSISGARAEIALIGGLTMGLDNLYDQGRLVGNHYSLVTALEDFFYNFERASEENVENKLNLDLCLQNIVKFRAQEGYFHDGDHVPSQRLTALAVKALHYLARVSPVDLELVIESLKWLHRVQNENGSFTSSCSSTAIAETSYIVSTLTDFQYEDLTTFQVVSGAQRFLEQELVSASEMNSIVQVSSAIVVSRSAISIEAERKLDSVFQQLVNCLNNEAGCLDVAVDALAAYFHANKPHHYLTLSKLLMNARWESLHSTDRIKAFLVWSKYGKLLAEPIRNLQVGVAFQSRHDNDKDKVESETVNYTSQEESQVIHANSLPLRYDVPQLPQTVQFSARGTGCVTLQSTISWVTPMPQAEEQPLGFTVDVDLRSNQTGWSETDPPEQMDFTMCIKSGNGTVTAMILEILMPSSYIIKQLRPLSSDSARAEINNGVGLVYANEMASGETSCYEVNSRRHGLVRNLQPGRILAKGHFGQRVFTFLS